MTRRAFLSVLAEELETPAYAHVLAALEYAKTQGVQVVAIVSAPGSVSGPAELVAHVLAVVAGS